MKLRTVCPHCDHNFPGVEKVKDLCEQLGYGLVMDVVSRLWKEKDPVGAFSIGPCLLFVEPCKHGGKKSASECNKCFGCGWVFASHKEDKLT